MVLGFAMVFACSRVNAQMKWYDPLEGDRPMVWNQAFTDEISHTYHRLPQRAKQEVRGVVWRLSQNSSGLALKFTTSSSKIWVRYTVGEPLAKPHMPATGVSGVDLYVRRGSQTDYCYGSYSFGDTIAYHYTIDRNRSQESEYELFLPLYNRVDWLEVGVPEKEQIEFLPADLSQRPIVVYGTSIVQGACVSRPAMAWTSILHREFNLPIVNLGFSGNGRLEKSVLNYITEIDAQLYVLDCMPNLTRQKEEEIEKLVIDAVMQIRGQHSEPILVVEHSGYSNMHSTQEQFERCDRANRALKSAYDKLRKGRIKGLYYLSRKELDWGMDAWVDSVHPSVVGMTAQSQAVGRRIRKILHL